VLLTQEAAAATLVLMRRRGIGRNSCSFSILASGDSGFLCRGEREKPKTAVVGSSANPITILNGAGAATAMDALFCLDAEANILSMSTGFDA
jgi:hypothetical protein